MHAAVHMTLCSLAVTLAAAGTVCAQTCPQADLTGDCRVDAADLHVLAQQWLAATAAPLEIDADGANLSHFAALARAWRTQVGPVVITEFMASNGSSTPLEPGDLLDEDGESPDWIELHNLAAAPVDLSNWRLTDDREDLARWAFPHGAQIGAGDYLVVFASGKTRATAGREFHTNFKLDAGGEYLALVKPDGVTIVAAFDTYEFAPGRFGFPPQERDVSYGIYEGRTRYFATATPGMPNNNAYEGIVADTTFSTDRGFYTAPFHVTIASATPGAAIRYTLDGSEPTETHGSLYTQPLVIDATTVLRAMAHRPGWMPTNIDTQTYIFNASPALMSLPAISLAADPAAAFYMPNGICAIQGGTYTGSYVSWTPVNPGDYNNPMGHGRAYERPVSVELIQPADNSGFQEDCGIRVSGSTYSRSRYTLGSKFSFRLYFRSDYGDDWLDYPIIPTAPVERFKRVVLRAGQSDKVNPFIKDELGRRLQKDMSGAACNGTFANLFINGLHKGYYNPCERIDEQMMQTQWASDLDWDVVANWRPEDDDYAWKTGDPVGRTYRFDARDGDMQIFHSLLDYALSHDLRLLPYYEEIRRRLDVTWFVDYLILEGYCHHDDWPHNNWAAARERSQGPLSRWRFYVWDIEHSFKSGTLENAFKTPTSSGGIQPIGILYEQLAPSPEFRQLFADRVQKHLFNGGALTQENVTARFEELRAIMAGVLPNMDTFIPDTWAPRRPVRVVQSLVDKGLFTFEGPRFLVNGAPRQGGQVAAGDVLSLQDPHNAGLMYYTLDGSDPRATAASQTKPVTLIAEDAPKKVRVPTTGGASGEGFALREWYSGISGTNIAALTSHPDFPGNPSGAELMSAFEAPVNWNDNYGTRMRAWLTPPAAGEYTFWIASDDNGQLWLGPDENPANLSLIAQVGGWTKSREWDKYASQKSAPVTLSAGTRCYIEALQADGTGGDNLAVAWQGPGLARDVIAGQYLSWPVYHWAQPDFDDSAWLPGSGGVGYETEPLSPDSYAALIGTDIMNQMLDVNTSCYVRVPFSAPATDVTRLLLRVRYDDGFVAYLNGVEIARSHFSGPPQWNSHADTAHDDTAAVLWEEFDITNNRNLLRPGTNLLALHGMNHAADAEDFLISAELLADEIVTGDRLSPTAIEYTAPIPLTETTRVRARTLDEAAWSGLNEAVFITP